MNHAKQNRLCLAGGAVPNMCRFNRIFNYKNYTTQPALVQALLAQTDRLMAVDSARYERHFLIWFSLHALTTGILWPEVRQ